MDVEFMCAWIARTLPYDSYTHSDSHHCSTLGWHDAFWLDERSYKSFFLLQSERAMKTSYSSSSSVWVFIFPTSFIFIIFFSIYRCQSIYRIFYSRGWWRICSRFYLGMTFLIKFIQKIGIYLRITFYISRFFIIHLLQSNTI